MKAATAVTPVPNFVPLDDLILVQPDTEPDRIGSIWLPQGVLPQGGAPGTHRGDERDTFAGTVVAVGPGDKRLRWKCAEHGRMRYTTPKARAFRRSRITGSAPRCPDCNQPMEYVDFDRHPMQTRVGDRILFPRRPSSPAGTDEGSGKCDVHINGVGYLLMNEEQSALAMIDEAPPKRARKPRRQAAIIEQ